LSSVDVPCLVYRPDRCMDEADAYDDLHEGGAYCMHAHDGRLTVNGDYVMVVLPPYAEVSFGGCQVSVKSIPVRVLGMGGLDMCVMGEPDQSFLVRIGTVGDGHRWLGKYARMKLTGAEADFWDKIGDQLSVAYVPSDGWHGERPCGYYAALKGEHSLASIGDGVRGFDAYQVNEERTFSAAVYGSVVFSTSAEVAFGMYLTCQLSYGNLHIGALVRQYRVGLRARVYEGTDAYALGQGGFSDDEFLDDEAWGGGEDFVTV